MFMREENLRGGLEGLCAGCGSKQKIDFREEIHLRMVYKIGTCSACNYEHSIFVGRL